MDHLGQKIDLGQKTLARHQICVQFGVPVGCVRLTTYAGLALNDKYKVSRAWPPGDVVKVHHAAHQGPFENTYVSARTELGDY